MLIPYILCVDCKHLDLVNEVNGRPICKAFPDGIPLDFDYSKVKENIECNNGVGFEPIKEKDTDFIMNDEYICDDRNEFEDALKIRSMTDEEFELYIKSL